MHRLTALALLGITLTASRGFCGSASDTPSDTPPSFKIMAYNIHGAGPVSRGDDGKKLLRDYRNNRRMPEIFAAEFAKLHLDAITLEEAESKQFVAELARKLGWNYAYFPGGWQDPDHGWPEGIPTAILTPHKIIEQTNCPLVTHETRPKDLFTRGYGRAVIDTGHEKLTLIVAHLLPSWTNTTHIRLGEISEILALAQKERAAGRSVLIGGDMNHRPDTPEYKAWMDGKLLDTLAAKGHRDVLTCPTQKPEERIDYIFALGPITQRLLQADALTIPPFAMPAGDSASYALSDHLPVFAEFAPPAK